MFSTAFFAIVLYAPALGGFFLEPNNFIPADPLKTPPHIQPLWYFTPYYSILRAVTEQFMWAIGAGTAGIAVLIVRSAQDRAFRGAEYVELRLKAFRSGERPNDANRTMRGIAVKMTDDEIRAVADYIVGLP